MHVCTCTHNCAGLHTCLRCYIDNTLLLYWSDAGSTTTVTSSGDSKYWRSFSSYRISLVTVSMEIYKLNFQDEINFSYYFSPQLSKLNQLTTQQVNKIETYYLYCIIQVIVMNVIHFNCLLLSVQSPKMSGWWAEPVTVMAYCRWNTRESGDRCWLGSTGTGCHHL